MQNRKDAEYQKPWLDLKSTKLLFLNNTKIKSKSADKILKRELVNFLMNQQEIIISKCRTINVEGIKTQNKLSIKKKKKSATHFRTF